jgi:hypothetical protein
MSHITKPTSRRAVISAAIMLFSTALYAVDASALTSAQCVANYQVAVAQANAQLVTATRNCGATTEPGPARDACLTASVDTHQAATDAALSTLRTCLAP